VARIFSAVTSPQQFPLLPSHGARRPSLSIILFFFLSVGQNYLDWPVLLHFLLSLSEFEIFLSFGGRRPLHNAQSPIFRIPTEDPSIRFSISSPKAFLSNPYDVLSNSRCNCRLVPGSFIPVLHSGPFHSHFSYFRGWSVILKKEYMLKTNENVVLRRISYSERKETTGRHRKIYNKEVHKFYPSNIVAC
jgi:hypothetical protein